nr:MAG TPA: hypothetical protein [Caudoviricetes sp.]
MTGTERRVLLLRSGEKVPVFAEDGRFYYCGRTRFRKTNADILKVEPVRASKEETDAEHNTENARSDAEAEQ